MKKIVLGIFGFLVLCCVFFALGRVYRERCNRFRAQDISETRARFSPANFPTRSHQFVFFIYAFNNGAYVEKTLKSISRQIDDHYRLIYIDDGSTDGSHELALDCIQKNHLAERTIFIHHEQKNGQLASLVSALQGCQDQDIIVVMQGEDYLAHEWVLSRLNQYYANNDLWLTYSQYCEYPSYRPGPLSQDHEPPSDFRQSPFMATHFQTFYAGLFKRINEADLMMQGLFIAERPDMAMMLPMMEMARDHFQFIPEIHSVVHPRMLSSEGHEQEIRCEKYIRSLKPYHPIEALSTKTDDLLKEGS